MRKLSLLLIAISLFIASCIPSLHPIYTDETRVFDERLEGRWINENENIKIQDLSFKNENNTKIDINKLELKLEDDDVFDGVFGLSSFGYWEFQRAANIRYEKKGQNNSVTNVTLEFQMMNRPDSTLLAKGFNVAEIELLDFYVLEYSDLLDESESSEKMKVNLTEIGGDLYMDFEPLPEMREATRFSVNMIPAHTFAKVILEDGRMIMKSFDSEYISELIKSKRVRLKHELVEETIILTASTEELRAFISKYGDDDELFMDNETLIAL